MPNDIHFVPRPILGYFGTIDERLDYGLILALAEADPNGSVVMVGPVERVDPERLPRSKNLFWIGRRPYAAMPEYAFGFQVCIAPFLVNDQTRAYRPRQLGEYLMSGRPVVCTALPEASAPDYGGLVRVAGTREEFVVACREALTSPDPEATERGRRLLAGRSWKKLAAAMEAKIDAFLADA